MAKLSRTQIKAAREQAKEKRSKDLEVLKDTDPEEFEKKSNQANEKKDKLGFTRQDRSEMTDRITEIDKPKPKISWNYSEGELVYLPNGEVGIIINNNAVDMELNNYAHDMKRNLSANFGQVFVVTSSGNNWYYPKKLKPVR